MVKHDVRDIQMDDALWGLLERYVVLLNKKLKARGLPRVTKGDALGAIACRFLLAHRGQIMDEYASDETKKRLGVLVRRRSHGVGLSTAADLLASVVPDVREPDRTSRRRR